MSESILGYVMARDEWPLLGMSITHALSVGVDRVVVLDHMSNDATASGIARLRAAWPQRIDYLRCDADIFLQRSATALVTELAEAHKYDWVYVFDADEFVLTPSGQSLRHTLTQMPEGVDIVRYTIAQWVAPHDLDDGDPSDYVRVTQRALPSLFADVPGNILAAEIERGHMNYFDVPFPSKVIVRAHLAHTLGDGSHHSRAARTHIEVSVDPSTLTVAHLPLRSLRYLPVKARQGQLLMSAGLPPGHGWQSQMLHRLAVTDSLKRFWAQHCIVDDKASESDLPQALPTTQTDLSLSAALQAAASNLAEALAPSGPTVRSEVDSYGNEPTAVDWSTALRAIEQQLAERDTAIAERDTAIAERDTAIAERDTAIAERDTAIAERDSIINSRIWRFTKGYRRLRR